VQPAHFALRKETGCYFVVGKLRIDKFDIDADAGIQGHREKGAIAGM